MGEGDKWYQSKLQSWDPTGSTNVNCVLLMHREGERVLNGKNEKNTFAAATSKCWGDPTSTGKEPRNVGSVRNGATSTNQPTA